MSDRRFVQVRGEPLSDRSDEIVKRGNTEEVGPSHEGGTDTVRTVAADDSLSNQGRGDILVDLLAIRTSTSESGSGRIGRYKPITRVYGDLDQHDEEPGSRDEFGSTSKKIISRSPQAKSGAIRLGEIAASEGVTIRLFNSKGGREASEEVFSGSVNDSPEVSHPLHPLFDQERRASTRISRRTRVGDNCGPYRPSKSPHFGRVHRSIPESQEHPDVGSHESVIATVKRDHSPRIPTNKIATWHQPIPEQLGRRDVPGSLSQLGRCGSGEDSETERRRRSGVTAYEPTGTVTSDTGELGNATTITSCANKTAITVTNDYKKRKSVWPKENKLEMRRWLKLLDTLGPYDSDYFWCPLFAGQRPGPTNHGELEPDWSNWPCDDFPMSRLDYNAISRQARRVPKEMEIAWSRARSMLTDPSQWNWESPILTREIRAKHRRAIPVKAFKRHLQKLLDSGVIRKAARDKIQIFLTAFEIPKWKKSRVRLIVNAIPTNRLTGEPMNMHLPGDYDIETAVLKFEYFLEADGKSYYNQFPLSAEVAYYFGLRIDNGNFVWSTGPMGWKEMPSCAQAATNVMTYDSSPGATLSYIDNVYVFGGQPMEVSQRWNRLQERFKDANAVFELTTNIKQEGPLLGRHVNLKDKTIALLDSFVEKMKQVRESLDACWHLATNRDVWRIIGAINWGSRVLRIGMYATPHYWVWVRRRARDLIRYDVLWDKPAYVWPTAFKEIKILLDMLIKNTPRSLLRCDDEKRTTIFVDASDLGVGAVCHGDWYSRPLHKNEIGLPIALRELIAVREGLKWATRKGSQSLWHIFTDNQNVVSWLRKKSGPSILHCKILGEIFSILNDAELRIEWIPSGQNMADAPSRLRAQPFMGG